MNQLYNLSDNISTSFEALNKCVSGELYFKNSKKSGTSFSENINTWQVLRFGDEKEWGIKGGTKMASQAEIS